MTEQLAFAIADASGAAEARRRGVALAEHLGFGETARGNIALVITEVATNLTKHAHGGQLILQVVTDNGRRGLDVLSLDRGPGIARPEEALRDGYSTAGSPGTGLGAIARLAHIGLAARALTGSDFVRVALREVDSGALVLRYRVDEAVHPYTEQMTIVPGQGVRRASAPHRLPLPHRRVSRRRSRQRHDVALARAERVVASLAVPVEPPGAHRRRALTRRCHQTHQRLLCLANARQFAG
jgi:anti-sigma regulatory factor (Ser/Thr protein kinase)